MPGISDRVEIEEVKRKTENVVEIDKNKCVIFRTCNVKLMKNSLLLI